MLFVYTAELAKARWFSWTWNAVL